MSANKLALLDCCRCIKLLWSTARRRETKKQTTTTRRGMRNISARAAVSLPIKLDGSRPSSSSCSPSVRSKLARIPLHKLENSSQQQIARYFVRCVGLVRRRRLSFVRCLYFFFLLFFSSSLLCFWLALCSLSPLLFAASEWAVVLDALHLERTASKQV